MKKEIQSAYIKLGMSVASTVAGLFWLFTMDTAFPEVTEAYPLFVLTPALLMFGISIWSLVDPKPVEL